MFYCLSFNPQFFFIITKLIFLECGKSSQFLQKHTVYCEAEILLFNNIMFLEAATNAAVEGVENTWGAYFVLYIKLF